MKTTKKILSGVLALSLSISSPFIVYAKSATSENVNMQDLSTLNSYVNNAISKFF